MDKEASRTIEPLPKDKEDGCSPEEATIEGLRREIRETWGKARGLVDESITFLKSPLKPGSGSHLKSVSSEVAEGVRRISTLVRQIFEIQPRR